MPEIRVEQVADGVYFVQAPDVNWVLLREGSDVTLVDAGYPGYVKAVEESVRRIGARSEDVRAVLVTHAHVDHLGAVNHFHAEYGTPAYLDPVEVRHARREYLEQADPGAVVKRLLSPGVAPWAMRIARAGATRDVTVTHAEPFPAAAGDALDLPGGPVPVATHGHTSGHSAFHLPAAGVVVTGDGLVTGHAVSLHQGPQLIADFFNHGDALAGLDPLEGLAADVVLPGHGRVHRGPIGEAVRSARDRRVARDRRAPRS